MVAIINTGHSIRSIFNYNENKVKAGVAMCIGEGNYPVDHDKLNAQMKLNRLTNQAALNENITRNSVHISLNFDLSESHLENEKLVVIAKDYMARIGFGQQPYLIYRHHDSGHPHIHIVSTKIQRDGRRIDMQNIGRNQSETARKEIEKAFGLVVAGEKNKTHQELKPLDSAKVIYGRADTKRAIANVLGAVLPHYKYTSLGELNAVLNLYNVSADQGSENSRIFLNNGIVYRVLDGVGKPVGIPIKASSFHSKPTLKSLESKFAMARLSRPPHAVRIKNAINLILHGKTLPLEELKNKLEKEGIDIVLRKSSADMIYGITYVDHKTKCVFNGSALGKQFSAKAIQERCGSSSQFEKAPTLKGNKFFKNGPAEINPGNELNDAYAEHTNKGFITNLAEAIMAPEQDFAYLPRELKGKKKKKKRNGQSDNK